jgi:hypothetical protein
MLYHQGGFFPSFLLFLQKKGAKKRSPKSMYSPISDRLDEAFALL